jgi:predicted peroxiredoxin
LVIVFNFSTVKKGAFVMTNNVVIALSCGTNDTNRSTRAIHLATIAHKEGKKTCLFLLDEGVYLAKKGIITHVRAATGDVADDLLAYLQAHEVPILVCTPCAKARQIEDEDLIEGARMATAAEFINISCDAAVISL